MVIVIKPRYKSVELEKWSLLNTRLNLTTKEKQYYLYQEKGFEGEKKYDVWLENLVGERLILNDLLLEVNNTKFQIDSLIITQERMYILDIKNYEGDYYYNNDDFYMMSGREIKNPLSQLKRSESLIRQLLSTIGFNFPIEGFLIFINPDFTIYEAPKNPQIVFPTQLNSFMKKLNIIPSRLNERHNKLAAKLMSEHIPNSPFKNLPHYEYGQLQKGVTCPSCHSFSTSIGERKLVCSDCGAVENIESAVMRSVEEFKVLFPDLKVTTKTIHEWCKVIKSKLTIRTILAKKLTLVGCGRFCYYE